ncbi:MAG: ABC transporter substrate-binding protein [Armatimonadota bacterium]|nr:ABC transporter substrate-binding protein [Armatimonadota bacterium]
MKRRAATVVVIIVLAGGLLPLARAGAVRELVVNAYGGEYEEIIKATILRPFEQTRNVRIVYDPTGSASADFAKIRATRGDPGWDVVVMTAPESLIGCQLALLERLSEDRVPNQKFIYHEVRNGAGPCGAVQELQYMSLMYNTRNVTPPPTSWRILWDAKYKGRIIVPDIGNILAVYLLFMAAYMNGGDQHNLEPGWAQIAALRDNALAVIESSADMVPYFERGQAWLLPYWDGRAHYYKNRGLPVDFLIPKEGTVGLVNTLNVPVGAKNKELAYEFINFWLSKEMQEKWAQAYTVGTARVDTVLPPEHSQRHVTSIRQLKTLKIPDFLYIGQKRSEWAERWKKIMVR